MQKIQSFIEEIDYNKFQEDEKTQDAVIRNFAIIGEAANQIPENEYNLRHVIKNEERNN